MTSVKTIAVANQKGGVGKTTCCVNLAAELGRQGKKVLLLDIDPQGNAGFGIGVNAEEIETTIYEVMLGELPIKEAIFDTDVENLYLIPSNIHLSGAQVDLLDSEKRD